MDAKNINVALSDIVILASSGMLTDDAKIKEQAIADIVDEIRSVMPELFPATAKKSKEEMSAEWFKKHYSFCNGLFPIRFVRTPDGCMEKCVINGRKFSTSLEVFGAVEGMPRNCEIHLHDNDKLVARVEFFKGKAVGEMVAHEMLKGYVMNISGSNKYSSRGGFLKQAVKRYADAKRASAPVASETMTTVGCPSLRPMPINLPSGFDGVVPSSEEVK